MFKPNKNDPLKNRRTLAILAAFHGFFIFPYVLIILHVSDALGGSLLTYMTTLTAIPIGGYLFAAHKKDSQNVQSS